MKEELQFFVMEMELVCVLIYKEFRNTVKRAIFLSNDLTDLVFKGA